MKRSLRSFLFTTLGILMGICISNTHTGAQHTGVDAAYIREIKALGYDDIDTDDIIALAALKVTPDYIKKIKALGYDDIDIDDIVALYALRIDPDYIKKIKALGFDDIDTDDIVALGAVGIDPDYIKKIKALGFDDIDTDDIVALGAVRADPDYVKELKESGIDDIDEIVALAALHVLPNVAKLVVPPIPPIPPIPAMPAMPALPGKPDVGHRHTFGLSVANNFASVLAVCALALAAGIVFYKTKNRKDADRQAHTEEQIETRITDFEKRVTDLQDILLSIDDRLDRRLRRA